jgi:hypothetical protein
MEVEAYDDGDDLVTNVDDEDLRAGRMDFEESTVPVNFMEPGHGNDPLSSNWKNDLVLHGFALNNDIELGPHPGQLDVDLGNAEGQDTRVYYFWHRCDC